MYNVCLPRDAIESMVEKVIDVLVVGNYRVTSKA